VVRGWSYIRGVYDRGMATAASLPPLSLYVHLPWCVRKCPYCDFNSYTLHGDLAESAYIEALQSDLEAQAGEVQGREVISIFFGGGTPSLFSPEAIGRVVELARQHLQVATDAEVTLEANPGTVERGRFDAYRRAGITRVSLGAQSFADRQLQALGRIHSADETRRAAQELHEAGLSNFNLDLMYALPGQDVAAAVHDLEEALQLQPAHVSHYQLTIEQGTVFAGNPPQLPDDDAAAEMLAACRSRLMAAGFTQYEVSAYALPGRRCRHNLNYWTFGDYLGVGAGAHGKLTLEGSGRPRSVVRTQQTREPRRFLTHPAGQLVRRAVPAADLPFEFMLNALRLTGGFERALFQERTGLGWDHLAARAGDLEARGLLEIDERMCRASARGLQFLNDVLLSFLEESPRTTGSFGLSTAL
jgi:putative oxygen-independent coproporphyrinogen III oxidase